MSKEFNEAIKPMSNMKAVGPDGVPSEAIKYSPSVKDKGVLLLDTIIHTLGYADDATLVDLAAVKNREKFAQRWRHANKN